MPLAEFVARLGDLPRDRQLLLVCRSGSRSLRATMYLMQQGFDDVANVDGGMIAWKNAGLPVRSGPLERGRGGAAQGRAEPTSSRAWRRLERPGRHAGQTGPLD